MKEYHVATGDGKGYYGVGYESYRQAESLLKISQEHDPQAHIVEEEYHFTNADRIRSMSDEELAELFDGIVDNGRSCSLICGDLDNCKRNNSIERICKNHYLKWLKQPAEVR